MIERLESRIAPAALSASGKLLTYTDIDGDLVKVTFTSPMNVGDFTFSTGSVNGNVTTPQQLTLINLQGKPSGIGLSLTASVQNGKGDSHANVEYINGTNVDLGSISIDGDLHQITGGAPGQAGLGISKLTVLSMGRVDSTVAISELDSAGSITVKTDIGNARLWIDNGVGSINVMGSLIGTDQDYSGRIYVGAKTGSIKVGGSLLAGSGSSSGRIYVTGTVGSISVGGSVIGSSGTGGDQIEVGGNIGSISVKGDLFGKSGSFGGTVYVSGNLANISIGGSVHAGSASYTGNIRVGGDIGKVSIGHDLIGGDNSTASTLTSNGSITAGGKIGNLSIGGVFAAGQKLSTGGFSTSGIISAHTTLGSVSIGEIRGAVGHQLMIEAAGIGLAGNANAIASVIVKGSSLYGTIVAGYENDLSAGNFLSSIGSVQVGGNFIGSRVVAAEIDGGNGVIGDGFDSPQNNASTINSVKIGGSFEGIAGSSEYFYIIGANLKKVQVGKSVYTQAQLNPFAKVLGSLQTALIYSSVAAS